MFSLLSHMHVYGISYGRFVSMANIHNIPQVPSGTQAGVLVNRHKKYMYVRKVIFMVSQ